MSNDRGSATIEFVLAVPLLMGMAAAAAEFGAAMRVNAQLDAAVRDAARILSITPADPNGDLLRSGVDRAFELVAERLAAIDDDARLAAAPGAHQTCAEAGSPCIDLRPVPGADAVFGRPRHEITLVAAAEVDTPLLQLVGIGLNRNPHGKLVMVVQTSQLHFD